MTSAELSGRVRDLVRRGRTGALAFEPSGATCVPLPEGVADLVDEVIEAATPLDPLRPDGHGAAVAAFEMARRSGTGTARVRRADGSPARITILDARQEAGCFLALVGSDVLASDDSAEPHLLPPRRFTARLGVTGTYLEVDEDFSRRLGWTRDQVIGTSSLELIHPDDHERSIVAWAELLEDPGGEHRVRQRFRTADGEWVWTETTDRNLLDDPAHGDVFAQMVDIADEMAAQTALREREQLLARLAEALPSGVAQVDEDGVVVFANARWGEITGTDRFDHVDDLLAAVEDPEALAVALAASGPEALDRDVEVTFTAPRPGAGARRHGLVRVRPLAADGGGGQVLVLDDVTVEVRQRELLVEAAERDPLTGVLNRAGVLDRLAALLGDPDPSVAVLFCDIDGLKEINDRYGHAVGDGVIRRAADVLTSSVRSGDLVGRLGGDEFLVVLTGSVGEEAGRVAERVDGRMSAEAAGTGGPRASMSVGVAVAHPGETGDELVRRADDEMYRAKPSRRAV